ncbi:nutrient deprivation-induced protein [Rhizobium herbae]|uniref:Nutrient deprivation-induced protein n=1 Tax=Rhizobium herbae TaxID=508661 RepID=A0ABS7HB55_9HYPH|nr:nutrient deprivation-induced protein [Rhizobium herbae]
MGFSELKDKVADDLDAARGMINDGAEAAVAKVKESVSTQTNFAARQAQGIASALEKVGAELEHGEQPQVGRYARQIGGSIQRFAREIEDRDIGEVAGMAEDFGRRQPLAFLGVAAIAGFAASRFLMASAKRGSGPEMDVTGPTMVPSDTQSGRASGIATGGQING